MKILLPIFFLIFLFTSCESKYQRGPIDEEAEREGQKYWESSLTKCGEFYVGVFAPKGIKPADPTIVQIKEPFFVTWHKTDEVKISEADKLNQLEWQGTTLMQGKSSRNYKDGKWSDWAQYAFGLPKLDNSFEVKRIRGKWEFGREGEDRYFALPCDQIPN